MRILKQLMIILFISFLGEILKMVIPLPIPASVYGLVIMVAALKTGILKLHQVKDAYDRAVTGGNKTAADGNSSCLSGKERGRDL